MYRKQDLQYLQDIFDRNSNDIAILYGSVDNDVSGVIADFAADKECLYYLACAVSEKTQIEMFSAQIHDQTKSTIFTSNDYGKLLSSFIGDNPDRKKLIVFDEFKYLVKENPTFLNFLSSLLFSGVKPGSVMVLLSCTDVCWIERDMIKLIGRKSSEISGICKLKDYTPTEFAQNFSDMPLSESVLIYSAIGGKSRYYDQISADTTFKDFIISRLNIWADADCDLNAYLPAEVREPTVYNTILTYIAGGTNKLNDLHNKMDIDRAKLSVYLKTLMENGIVRKAVSAEVGNMSNTVKGMYLICDREVLFYYRFVFPNYSALRLHGAERFYRRYIEKNMSEHMEDAYPMFCIEQVRWLESEGRLSFKVASIEEYYDKNKAIDFVIVAAGGSVIACKCRYSGPHMSFRTYEDVKTAVRRNKIISDNIWLFSVMGFDQKLTMTGSVTPGLSLIEGLDQRLR